MKYLIVSADDLGLSQSINRGILTGYEEGIVTALNVIPSGDAFYDAMASLRVIKPKEVSAHLALTETSPVMPPEKVPTLLAGNGKFHKSYTGFLPGYLLNRMDPNELYYELKSQLARVMDSGVPVTSLSSHQHIHVLPGILDIFIRLAKEYNVPCIRYLRNDRFFHPYVLKKVFKKMVLGVFQNGLRKSLDKASILHADNLLGFLDSGNIREELLINMMNTLPGGVTELVTHPGFISSDVLDRCIFHKDCETDLAALVSRRVRKAITDNNIRLISFGDFARLKK